MTKRIYFAVFLISCSANHKVLNDTIVPIPPGTVKLAENLYFDQAGIRNIDYLEFLHWTMSVYGSDSDEYRSVYPDTPDWKKISTNYTNLDSVYLTHSSYRKLGVLGVSTDQAKKFTKWRSDRVMEFMLITKGVLKYKMPQAGSPQFTIESYFSGQYENIKPDLNLLYPEYRLLDSLENTETGFRNYCTYKKWKIN